jgi:serine/threonine-protein kinase
MSDRGPLAPERWERLMELFDELVELTPAERERRRSEVAAADGELAGALERLLAADAAGGEELLETPAGIHELPTEPQLPAEAMPERAGPYRLVGLLGRGGMADVYAGERDDGGFAQRVAVKVLRRGLDTRDLLARFLRERRILARLEHPAIARLLDGGELADGRPYLAMERVDGLPMHRYAEHHALGVEQRLALLRTACDAVAFAHRSLVVHRDLKPSNVLVTERGEVKLLDFGIAKLLAADEDDVARTATLQRLLTPAYAAPEQRAGGAITTATDVWGLGALAYELLVGEPPYEAEPTISSDPLALPERPPPKPSARVLALRGGTA